MSTIECEMMNYLRSRNDVQKDYQKVIEHLQAVVQKGDTDCKEKYYDFIIQDKILGRSFEERIFIMEENGMDGIAKEYALLEGMFGEKDIEYVLIKQMTTKKDNCWLDIMDIKLQNGTERKLYFDITYFFGK